MHRRCKMPKFARFDETIQKQDVHGGSAFAGVHPCCNLRAPPALDETPRQLTMEIETGLADLGVSAYKVTCRAATRNEWLWLDNVNSRSVWDIAIVKSGTKDVECDCPEEPKCKTIIIVIPHDPKPPLPPYDPGTTRT